MKLPRRAVLQLAAGAVAVPVASRLAGAQNLPARPASEQPVHPLAERLAAYADGLRYDDIDEATVERVKTHVIDTIGCGIGAFAEKPVGICREVALAAGGNATIIGTDRRTTPDLASFANGAAFRYFDFNDTYTGRFSVHPSDHIAPCLAVAEAERASARDLITAIVLAYEVNCRLVDALDIATRGWDPPVMSLPAVALAAGKLMKLDPQKLTQAVNLAINDHIPMAQTRVQTLSDWKGFADAEAARNAVFAALLARGGLTGPAPIFEGQSGFFKQVSGPGSVDVDSFGRRGVPFRILKCAIKPYPAVIYTQTAIVAAIEVAKEVGSLDRIAAIEIATTSRGLQRTGGEPEKWAPKTRETADHSLPYITARAMFDGDITNESFAPPMFGDPKILAFMQKITVHEDPVLTARIGAAVPTRVTAILADGRRISREEDYAPGFAERPMTRAEVERKFRGNVGTRWPAERTDEILKALWALDRTEDLSVLLGKLSLQAKQ
ncbi:MAG TPA: MmgE/PrpD family protein [Bradyrhizobium sp.]|uniref:MmgE/PrpD family protein n=1 Tax=Bradyrhizobium sp. TaxID=376 RepID=UPI002C957B23|nr:MmgE/PrpD family protein [Bradyrhizobium sp.]HTB03143.1 MmgE/PrpD family protein [Bradyrhizobium sp.]